MASVSTTSAYAFGIALKRARRAARLTQAQFAERAGFSVVYISMLERGARQTQRTTVALLAEARASTRAMPYPHAEAKRLWGYGRLEAARQNPVAARKHFKQALAICDRLDEGLYRKHIERDLAALQSPTGPASP
jgi:transcriptional regulator with XRE-family HTH domain